jgi:hypothetical protein
MKTIEIQTPDGKTISLNAPDTATPDQIQSAAAAAVTHYKSTMPQQQPQEQQGMVGKAWDAMKKPAEMAQDGLQQMTGLQTDAQNAIAQKTGLPIGTEPTGNLPRDIAANIPRIAGETMAEVAPKFIDRTSLATMGAGAAVKGAGMAAGKVLEAAPSIVKPFENVAGLKPGTLNAAFKDPGMIADFGAKVKASALYNAIKDGSQIPAKLRTNAGLVRDAIDEMNQGNVLDARDAFKARKAVKALLGAKDSTGSFPKDDLYAIKDGLEQMIFSSVKKADVMWKRAIQGEQLRSPFPLNNNGTSSKVGAAVMHSMPAWLQPMFSPLAQGAAMSGLGAASQMAPQTIAGAGGAAGGLIDQGFDRLRKRKKG